MVQIAYKSRAVFPWILVLFPGLRSSSRTEQEREQMFCFLVDVDTDPYDYKG